MTPFIIGNGHALGVHLNLQCYQMIEGDYALHFDGQKVTALYNLKTDPQQLHNIKDQPGTPLPTMLLRLKAYLQDYTWRMKYNKLTELHPQR